MRKALGVAPAAATDDVIKSYVDYADGTKLQYQGRWDMALSYSVNDIVTLNGQAFICTQAYTPTVGGKYIGYSGYSSDTQSDNRIALPAGAAAGDVVAWIIATQTAATAPIAFGAFTVVDSVTRTSGANAWSNSAYTLYTLTATDITNGYLTIPAQAGTIYATESAMMAFRTVTIPAPAVTGKTVGTPTPITTPISTNALALVVQLLAVPLAGGAGPLTVYQSPVDSVAELSSTAALANATSQRRGAVIMGFRNALSGEYSGGGLLNPTFVNSSPSAVGTGDASYAVQLTQASISTTPPGADPDHWAVLTDRSFFQDVLTGGGVLGWDGVNFSFTQRFITLGRGKSEDAPTGYFAMPVPAAGDIIPVYGNATVSSVTALAGAIPFPSWHALYYAIPYGAVGSVGSSANYNLVDYSDSAQRVRIPSNWVLIALRNTDLNQIHVADGRYIDVPRTPALSGTWVANGGGYEGPAYYKDTSGVVHVSGLVKSGSVVAPSPIFTLPAGYRPSATLMFTAPMNGTMVRIDVLNTGVVQFNGFLGTTAVTGYLSLSGISFLAEQ